MTAAASVSVRLPDQPTECREHLVRVVPQLGEKARWTQQRWEVVADNRDKLTDRCAEFYDGVRSGLEARPTWQWHNRRGEQDGGS